MDRVLARLRRLGVRLGVAGGPSEFTRAVYLVPRQVVLVTAQHGDEEALWPVDWHMPVGIEPPRYALSFGAEGHGTGVALAAGAFVVNFVGAEHEAVMIEAGARSGHGVNKREALALAAVPAAFVSAPRLRIARGWLECQVEDARRLDDRFLVVGRVLHAQTAPPGEGWLVHQWPPR